MSLHVLPAALLLVLLAPSVHSQEGTQVKEASPAAAQIQPYAENPWYWQYKGEPVLLLGGSVDDNLFQIPDLIDQLDLLHAVGGNYVRCTMSCRDEGNVWPFAQVGDKYDLDRWNDEFWRRFAAFLQATAERDIIVQFEIWATFDYYRDCWDRNPFNPKNNVTYTTAETGLPEVVNSHPTRCRNNFFWSVPDERNQRTVLEYQQRFVDKLLSYSLTYDNCLYGMDNETSVTPKWGAYWATYIRRQAAARGKTVYTTEMWDRWSLDDPQHANTIEHPETYQFVDVSQNNHQKSQRHYDNMQKARARIAAIRVRPLTNVKIYGADRGHFGNTRDGIERFWRNIFGGCASARFHRPPSGQGLNQNAQRNIRAARAVTNAFDLFACQPHNDLLSDRDENEAYCLGNPGKEYAVYFPAKGNVLLKLEGRSTTVSLRWFDLEHPEKTPATVQVQLAAPGEPLRLRTPVAGPSAVVVKLRTS